MGLHFVFNGPVDLEESLTCEFKEVTGSPVEAIARNVDEYVVAFLNAVGGSVYWGIRNTDRVVTGVLAPYLVRDQLRQAIGQRLSQIAPSFTYTTTDVPLFHPVRTATGEALPDTWVVEMPVPQPSAKALYVTGGGTAYRRTPGGNQKLNGAQLIAELAGALQAKTPSGDSLLATLPAVHRRSQLVKSVVAGAHVLFVDDHSANNIYERAALAELGAVVHTAASTEEALALTHYVRPDVVVSDMARGGETNAGMGLLRQLRNRGISCRVIFYVAALDVGRGVPGHAFGITNRPDELLHLVLDALERKIR